MHGEDRGMMVYREQRRRVRTEEALRRVEGASGLDRLIEWGMVQAGIADEVFADADGEWPGEAAAPREITLSIPEGFAYFALHPELYRMAARRFAGDRHPARVAVIGIRSIGLPLGAVVEEELRSAGCGTAFWSVRPRGHPWDRRLAVTEDLARRWREWDGWFAVVDEGPGLSGSSFGCVSAFLAGLGIADERVVLFPSRRASGEDFVRQRRASAGRAIASTALNSKSWTSFPMRAISPAAGGARSATSGPPRIRSTSAGSIGAATASTNSPAMAASGARSWSAPACWRLFCRKSAVWKKASSPAAGCKDESRD